MNRRAKFIFLIVVLVVVAPLTRTLYNKILDRVLPTGYEEYVEKYSEENGLTKELVWGIIKAESNFDEKAHSGYARGLMQITDDTAKWILKELKEEYKEDLVEDPEANIKMGCFYLAYLIKKYDNTDTALAAYNAGPGNVNSWLLDERYSSDEKTLTDIPYGETKKYVKRVNLFKTLYEKLY